MKLKIFSHAGLACASLALLMAVQFCVPGRAADCFPAPAGMAGWWKAESNAVDSVSGNNGVLLGGAAFAAGEAGQAFAFNGTSSYVQVADTAALRLTSELTIEFWARRQQVGSPDYLVNKGGDWTQGGLNYGVAIAGNDFNNIFHFLFAGGVRGTISITDLNWHHYAVTARHGDADPVFYVDGVPQTVTYHQGAATINLYPSTKPLNIGAQIDPTFNYFGHALIDELGIYNRILSAAEIQSLYNAGSAGKCAPTNSTNNCVTPPSGLVGWWPGEGNANDVIGGDNGVLQGGATFAPGKVGQGFRFDGANSYLQIPDSAALKPANVTAEAWVWLDPNVNTGAVNESIIFRRNSCTFLFEGYSLLKASIDNGNGTYSSRFQSVVTRNGNQIILNSSTVVQRAVWYHVATTYDGNTLTLYVNGVAEGSVVAGFALDYGTRPVFIGTSGEPAPYTSMFAGIIDEPSIYARALSTNEIAALYTAGGADKCNVPVAPTIVVQPQDTAVPFGSTAVFNVFAGGTLPLSYQWFVNSNALHDETNSTLTLNNLTLSQSGNLYSVTITNTGGFTLSSNAVLTVLNTPPQITAPGDQIVSYLAPSLPTAVTWADFANDGDLDTESPLADLSNGYRRVVRVGDASTNRWRLSNLPPGNYY